MTSQIATTWPTDVLLRFLTIVGATVDVVPQPTTALPDRHAAICRGCEASYFNHVGVSYDLKDWAQTHSGTCRALPRPTA
ncbi:hypothetical protein HRW07_06550 [Streptomyces lunaelactis]|uniref:hypothetical protein n=1 Tax=Streptomyces lunaelactis TaxID=1535768 RepID=UPI0015853638|nr:hypothetical protein [Streptomyces lunaelactis]NUL02909.1 hypothetical protein [Streptomyces lunaelactis]